MGRVALPGPKNEAPSPIPTWRNFVIFKARNPAYGLVLGGLDGPRTGELDKPNN